MSERVWYQKGICRACLRDIMRRYDYRGGSGNTLSYVCYCAPKYEEMGKMTEIKGSLVVWDDRRKNNGQNC